MVFDESPQRDLVLWTTLIQGYVKMGFPREGIEVFFDMCDAERRADEMTSCADADFASKVFNEMPVRNVVFWNSMISGLAHQGKFKEALYVFREMQKRGPERDEVTYIGGLAACSHGGLVAEDQRYFREMSSVHKLRPQTEHYGCTVDLLGHAGVEPERDGAYVLTSNVHSSANRWRDAVKLRWAMKGKNVKKTPGCSSIEL
ncbi:pentatricopeptide repeat-containing protein At1g08070, chloroplastic-like [Pyrus x bretschneideri]|uniref:pentatricopeptide repeat-containing protein At1g08070, chloroplastic-like n=1 Tax=Pyrus x bretschneideri TaxID=225117 RepID=UPI00202F4746|nr:pentatricopeptide repeat-containing protein At1g08070, chloroplastic-like [Pyrus x bretschneideri]